MALSFSLNGAPIKIGKFQQTETIMYQNKVTLIGFLGSNPEARTKSPDFSVTTLSLATKASYKKDGKYISHTDARLRRLRQALRVRQNAH